MTKRVKLGFGICKMCGREYSLDGEVAGVLGQLAPGEDLSGLAGESGGNPAGKSGAERAGKEGAERAGKEIELDLCGLPVSAMRVGADSPASQQGLDVLFLVCSWDCVAAIRLAAELDAATDGHEVDRDSAGVHGLRLWRPEQLMTSRSLEKLELFESKLRSILPEVAERMGCDRPGPVADPHASTEDPASIQELLSHNCAWCLHTIGKGRQRLPTRMKDDGEPIGESRGVVFKVGERVVPAERVEPGSPEFAKGNAIFHLCSKDCMKDLTAAIAQTRGLRVVH